MDTQFRQTTVAPQPPVYFQFGGQGANFLTELQTLYQDYPQLHPFFAEVDRIIAAGLEYLDPDPAILPLGFKLVDWISGQNIPPVTYLNQCTIALTGIHVTQSAYYHLLTQSGLSLQHASAPTGGLYGHSMGFHSAHLAALDLSGDSYYEALRKFVLFVLIGGYRCQQTFPLAAVASAVLAISQGLGDPPPSAMVATLGLNEEIIAEYLAGLKTELPQENGEPRMALINSPDSIVISGRPHDLIKLRAKYFEDMNRRGAKWTYLDVSAPFHCHLLEGALPLFAKDNAFIGFHFTGAHLHAPVFSTLDGHNSQSEPELYQYSFRLMTSMPLNWPRTVAPILRSPTREGVILDCGPGRATRKFTTQILEDAGYPLPILTTTHRPTLRKLVQEGCSHAALIALTRDQVR